MPKTKFIENLDELPFPARHLLPMEEYSKAVSPHSGIKRTPFASMITSRGCPARCTFCVLRKIWGLAYRTRSPDNVLDEIEHLIKEYGIREIHFEDDNLTADKKRAMAIFDGIIKRKFNITWNCPSGTALFALDEELLTKMKESGCYSISIAIESGNKDVLRNLMRKPINLDKAPRIVNAARELGLKIKGFFILGYPRETKKQMQETVDFAANLGLDWALFFIATPIPGSELLEMCKKGNYLVNENLDYVKNFFVSNIRTPEFTPEYVEKLREEANFNINFKNNINLRLGNYDKAISDFSEVVKLYPRLDFAHFYLGVAYEKKGLIEKAVLEWKKTLELNPNYDEAKDKLKGIGYEF
jgi:magnesium-protoporphyrin IX monomethyl ester (oxidative) cyclase